MISVYFTNPIDDEQIHNFYDAEYAEVKEDYLVLTGPSENENSDDSDETICSYEVVGMFLMKNVLGWARG